MGSLCESPWKREGSRLKFVAWEDTINWQSFDVVLIRSTWDCVSRPGRYLAWAKHVASVTVLLNPIEMLRWNMNKRYLADLAADQVPVVPTTWIEPSAKWEPPPGEFVVKPMISGGGIDTARYGPDHQVAAVAHVNRLQRQGRGVMVQPDVPSVDTMGEPALVFVGGQYSHTVRKRALLTLGEGVVARLWEREVVVPASPTPSQMAVAQAAVGNVCRRFGTKPTYAG